MTGGLYHLLVDWRTNYRGTGLRYELHPSETSCNTSGKSYFRVMSWVAPFQTLGMQLFALSPIEVFNSVIIPIRDIAIKIVRCVTPCYNYIISVVTWVHKKKNGKNCGWPERVSALCLRQSTMSWRRTGLQLVIITFSLYSPSHR